MTINLARSTCRASGPNNRGNNGETRPNSSPRLASPRLHLASTIKQAHLSFLPSSFLLGFHFPILEVNVSTLQFYAEREREREREGGKNQSAFVGLHQMDVGRGGREGARRKKKRGRPRRGEARRRGEEARRGATEKREGNARIEATRPWQQLLGSARCSTGCSGSCCRSF